MFSATELTVERSVWYANVERLASIGTLIRTEKAIQSGLVQEPALSSLSTLTLWKTVRLCLKCIGPCPGPRSHC